MLSGLKGHISFVLGGIVLILFLSIMPADEQRAYSQLASAEPSAAQQIWEIGNQPVDYLQTGQGQTQSQGQMWDLNSSYQNIEFQNSVSLQNNQSDVWSQLNTEVQSSQSQVANNPIQESTFNANPSDLSAWQAQFTSNNDSNFDAQVNDSGSDGWFSSMTHSFNGWLTDAHDYLFGAPDMNACPDGVCANIGIRG